MKENNKGFSLIELIIVIAIMAVLVAIIAPNLTKYLGSSKKHTDNKNIDEVVSQVKNCISDASTDEIAIDTGDITLTGTGGTVTADGTASSFKALICKALKGTNTKSKVTPGNTKIKVHIGGSESAGYDVTASFVS